MLPGACRNVTPGIAPATGNLFRETVKGVFDDGSRSGFGRLCFRSGSRCGLCFWSGLCFRSRGGSGLGLCYWSGRGLGSGFDGRSGFKGGNGSGVGDRSGRSCNGRSSVVTAGRLAVARIGTGRSRGRDRVGGRRRDGCGDRDTRSRENLLSDRSLRTGRDGSVLVAVLLVLLL